MKIITKPETAFPACDACRIADHSAMIKIEGDDGRGGYQDVYLCAECAERIGELAIKASAKACLDCSGSGDIMISLEYGGHLCLSCAQEAGALAEEVRERGNER